MKTKIILFFMMLFSSLAFSQIQSFNTQVRFKTVNEDESAELNKVAVLDETGLLKWVDKSQISGASIHNDLEGLQGGNQDERYHLSLEQYEWILSQLYTDHTATFTVTPSTGERGVNTNVTVNYNIISNDDEITSATINQGIGSVFSDVDDGAKSVSGGIRSNNITWTLSIGYNRMGESGTQNRTATYTTYIPKWHGLSESLEDVTTGNYALLNSELNKLVNNSNSMSFTHNSNTDEYIWFVSPLNINKITASGFDTTIGNWNDPGTFFWKKSLPGFVLANGIDTVTIYLYRTREKQNTGGNDIPYVFNP